VTTVQRDLVIVSEPAALAREGAALVRAVVRESVQARGRCAIALAGGRTPRGVYEVLAEPAASEAGPIDWSAVELWFGDERHVPPDHPDSNYRMVRESLLAHVSIPASRVHRMRTEEADATSVAAAYEEELRRAFAVGPRRWPVLDLVLLGMGSDGHTASLFPGTPVIEEREHLAAAVWVTTLQTSRITLTLPVFNHARHVIVLVNGVEKAETLHAVLEGPTDPDRLPIQAVQPRDGSLTFLIDEPAASRLSPLARTASRGR
jgi:6-phosphogluconolactonase